MKDIMDFFPLSTPRPKQTAIIRAIDGAIQNGAKTILLESPVGSGKSAIAMTLAKYRGDSHTITTQKALQGQYHADFNNMVVTMKGRNAYPCIHPKFTSGVSPIELLNNIERGNCEYSEIQSCANGICTRALTSTEFARIVKECSLVDSRGCPYQMAAEIAANSGHVIHNTHSFFFQTKFTERFDKRSTLVIDECHDLEPTIRDIGSITVTLRLSESSDVDYDKFTLGEFKSLFTSYRDAYYTNRGEVKPGCEENYEKITALIDSLETRYVEGNYVCKVFKGYNGYVSFTFTILDVGDIIRDAVMTYGDVSLMMSGTIYNKEFFCGLNGLDPEEVTFIRSTSEFPVENRLVIYSKSLGVNCQRATWYKEDGLGKIIRSIKTILEKHPNEKGLIHVGSYEEASVIKEALRSLNRIVIHTPEDYEVTLNSFYRSEVPNLVLISPRSQQGVDMFGDRARFQIITKVPYLNVGDKVIQKLKDKNRLWYNLRTLIVFGQQLGRIVRSPSDYGRTYLLDSRFPDFLRGMWNYIPEWQREAFRMIQ